MLDIAKSETQEASAADLYLDLMKRCLTDSIFFDEPLAFFVPYESKETTNVVKRFALRALQAFLQRYKIRLVEPYSDFITKDFSSLSTEEINTSRQQGDRWPVRAHTMIGLKRLGNIQHCVETVIRDGVPGDLIETGVWRGGSCIFMRAILKAFGETERTVWVADSFSGLPPPDESQYPADEGDVHHTFAKWLAVSRESVAKNFQSYGLLDSNVRFLEGWFKDTLPNAPIERLAVLRLDGDMYESTIQALDALYIKLSPGGFVIVDDFALPNCAKAVRDFRAAHGITDEIVAVDWTGVYWRRSQ